ncbi:MAG: hypothetical protein HUU43_17660 [Ignavibacteriaceae bacterium]|nr:hypothetical protein [Ignavibacteriaceae bacterium]
MYRHPGKPGGVTGIVAFFILYKFCPDYKSVFSKTITSQKAGGTNHLPKPKNLP